MKKNIFGEMILHLDTESIVFVIAVQILKVFFNCTYKDIHFNKFYVYITLIPNCETNKFKTQL